MASSVTDRLGASTSTAAVGSPTSRLSGYTSHPGYKSAVKVASTGNLILYGSTQTIDGIAAAVDYRVLVKDQASAVDNGIYLVDSSTWARDRDFDGGRDSIPGTIVYVDRGTAYGDTFWTLNSSSTATSVTIGTDTLTWTQVTVALAGVSTDLQVNPLPLSIGGTSSTSAANARTALGLAIGSDVQAFDAVLQDVSVLTLSTGDMLYYSSGSSLARLAVGSSGQVLTSTGGRPQWLGPASNGITLGVEQTSTAGTSIDFTGIPAGTKRITIQFVGVSSNGTSNYLIQIGGSTGIEATGYLGAAVAEPASGAANFTAGFGINSGSSANVSHGSVALTLENAAAFTWIATGFVVGSNAAFAFTTGGSKSLSAELDRVRFTTVGGTDTFDAGAINILYE